LDKPRSVLEPCGSPQTRLCASRPTSTPEFWLNLQTKFELETQLRDQKVVREIHKIEEMAAA
jgi:plasmid maintenance system antidote protein VapI